MKSPTGRFNSGNSLGCHFQHFGARERESKAQSSMQPRLHTALRLTLSLSLSGTSMLKVATLKIARINDR